MNAGRVPPTPRHPTPIIVMGRAAPLFFALGALALVFIFGSVFHAEGTFFTAYTHSSTLGQTAAYLILACGMTVVIITGGIDLSVGSLVALCGVVMAQTAIVHGWPAWLAILGGIATGAAAGAASGAMIGWLGLQPFVATLAMMAFARGLAKWLSDNAKIGLLAPPPLIERLDGRVPIAGSFALPVAVFPALACVVLVLLFLRFTTGGLAMYAIGDNPEAARYAGVPVRRTRLLAYAISGALAGLAGVIVAAREHQGNPDGAVGYELTAIAMVVVGGTSLAGGRGGVLLTVLGALTIGYLQKILDINGFETYKQLMITGAIIALAVLVQGLRRR